MSLSASPATRMSDKSLGNFNQVKIATKKQDVLSSTPTPVPTAMNPPNYNHNTASMENPDEQYNLDAGAMSTKDTWKLCSRAVDMVFTGVVMVLVGALAGHAVWSSAAALVITTYTAV